METEYYYTCPNCSRECTLPESMAGQNVICPSCTKEFFATPPERAPSTDVLPEKLPFFKWGRRKILEKRLRDLTADGELDKNDERELTYLAASLRLDQSELSKLQKENFLKEFDPVKPYGKDILNDGRGLGGNSAN